MKILKWIIIVVLILVAFLLVIAAFIPSEQTISQSIEIEKSPRLIFNQINSLKNWESWSPFQEADSNMTSEYFGPEVGVGNRQVWKSPINGDGSMEIVKSVNENEVLFDLDLGMGTIYPTWFTLERNPQSVNVTWSVTMKNIGYPIWRLMMPLFKGQMEKSFLKGLQNLKKMVEEMPPDCISGEVQEVDIPARLMLSVSGKATTEELGAFLGQSYGAMMGVIQASKLKVTGAPLAFYQGDETTVEWGITAALVVDKIPAKIPEGILKLEMPQTKAVCIVHSGAYHTTSDSYRKILDYIGTNEIEITGDCWEEYLTDPEGVQDPMQIQTRICFPVK
jgi:effector-binding domain-containing protein